MQNTMFRFLLALALVAAGTTLFLPSTLEAQTTDEQMRVIDAANEALDRQDWEEAIRHLSRAVELGRTDVIGTVVQLHLTLGDYERALGEARRGVSMGDSHSQLLLGEFYLGGDLVPADTARAKELLLLAAEHENDSHAWVAQYMLGQMYYHGLGVERDLETAYAYFDEAVHDDATAWQGVMLYGGMGVEKDERQGRHLMCLAMKEYKSEVGAQLVKATGVDCSTWKHWMDR